jgi:hypothetical protein
VLPFRISDAVTADDAVMPGFDFDQCCTVQPTPSTPKSPCPMPGGNIDCCEPGQLVDLIGQRPALDDVVEDDCACVVVGAVDQMFAFASSVIFSLYGDCASKFGSDP